jgi:hypothetical protein
VDASGVAATLVVTQLFDVTDLTGRLKGTPERPHPMIN